MDTRTEAIVALQNLLVEQLANAEIIPLELTESQRQSVENPWIKFAGMFTDDPDLAEIAEELRRERQQLPSTFIARME